jgi:hypothetical protein|tara:strand:+ start:1204 stop:1380 length:177 start_codon:yes stop_codon:yes gene_type:complete
MKIIYAIMLGMNMSNQTQQALYLQLEWFGLTASVVRTPTVVGSKTVTRFFNNNKAKWR